jgi:hypothetical protein
MTKLSQDLENQKNGQIKFHSEIEAIKKENILILE